MWLPLALTAALLTSFLPIINKRLLADADVTVVTWGVNTFSLPILAVVAFILLPVPEVDNVFWAGVVLSASLNLVATLLSTQALKLGDASLVTPFLTFNPAFTLLIAAITLEESPNLNGILGVLLIVAGGYVLNIEDSHGHWWDPLRSILAQRSILLAILASLVWGVTPIAEKLAIQHSEPENPPLVAFATTALMCVSLVPALWPKGRTTITQVSKHKQGFAAGAVIAGVAPLFGFTAISLGLVAYVTAVFKLSTVATVIWASLLLKEARVTERLAGSLVMVLGALVISL